MLSDLALSLKTQLNSLHASSDSLRPELMRSCKATLLQMRAALRSARESQHKSLTLLETKAQELPKDFVKVRVSEFQKRKISEIVARLKNEKFPELDRLEPLLGGVPDDQLLQTLGKELVRRQDLQRKLNSLNEERKILETQISENHELNRKFLARIAALDDFLVSLQEISDSAMEIDQDPEISALRDEQNSLITGILPEFSHKITGLGEFGLCFKIVNDEKNFTEISVHEKFPSLKISRSKNGRVAASEGAVVDPVLAEICKNENIQKKTFVDIFKSVLSKLEL